MTREVGNYNNAGIVDATADQVVITPITANVGFAFQDSTFSTDTSAHKPAPIKLVTIVGLPVNDATGASMDYLRGWQFLPLMHTTCWLTPSPSPIPL